MKHLLQQAALFFGMAFLVASCTKTFSKEEIDKMFEPITSKYGINIVYEIGEDFGPILLGGERTKFNKAEPIDHRVLARYPRLLEKAFEKYTPSVIKEYLTAIYFAKALDCDALQYSGTYDPFRRVVYLVNDGKQQDAFSIAAFHHEFSSILLNRHTFFLNPWLELNPRNFKYSQETSNQVSDIYGVSIEGTIADYQNGFLNAYSQISFEDDFNEFSRIIFTQPKKFKKIINQYPQIRGKFMIWLEFYHKIDPIFTKEYLLSES